MTQESVKCKVSDIFGGFDFVIFCKLIVIGLQRCAETGTWGSFGGAFRICSVGPWIWASSVSSWFVLNLLLVTELLFIGCCWEKFHVFWRMFAQTQVMMEALHVSSQPQSESETTRQEVPQSSIPYPPHFG